MAKITTIFNFLDNVSPGMKKMQNSIASTSRSMSNLASTLLSVNSAIGIFSAVSNQFRKITASVEDCVQAYQYQSEQELKLTTIMRQRMGATDAEINKLKEFASAQQQIGIYGDEMILQGAQELASFVSTREAVETLIPAMNNLIAQQYGLSASGQNFQMTADMMGKVLSGQTGALSRLGYVFSEEEKAMLKNGDEMQRASVLAKIITDNVGEMNQAMAGTQAGAIQSITNKLGDMKEEVGAILQPLKSTFTQFKSTVMLDFYTSLNNTLKKVVPIIQNVIKAFQEIYTKARPYIQKIGDFINNVFGRAFKWVINNLKTIELAVITLSGIIVAKSLIMFASWILANLPLIAIIALIGLFIKKVADSGTSMSVVGKHIGKVLGAIYTIGYQAVTLLWNLFIDFANFLGNLFDNPIYAIDNLFYQLVADIIGFFAILPGEIGESARKASQRLSNWSSETFGGKFNIEDYGYSKMDFANAEDFRKNVEIGSDIGSQIGSKIESANEILKNALKGGITDKDIASAIQQGFNFTGGGDLSVSDKNMVDIADDYRELLSKRATERFNLQYRNVTPAINIDHLDVHEEADENRMIGKFSYLLNEFTNSSLAVG